jgi:hypothetical protein
VANNKLLPATGTGTSNVTVRTLDRSGVDTPIQALDLNPGGSESLMAGFMPVAGDVAHDAADSGAPVKTGSVAVAHGASPTAVAAGDRVQSIANRHGIPFVQPGHPEIVCIEYVWTTAQTDDAIVSASAGEKIVVLEVRSRIDEAVTVGTGYRLGFGASTLLTTPTDGNTATGMVNGHPGLIPGGGENAGSGYPLGIGADGDDLRVTTEAPTSGSGRLYITYYKVPS